MNNNTNNDSNSNVDTYKASSNMNTFIDSPNANFNPMMDVNIQNTNTNTNNELNVSNVNSSSVNSNDNVSTMNDGLVTRTYVSSDNKPKKKTVKINLGTEFKIALLIVVVLLVFILLIPYFESMFRGY